MRLRIFADHERAPAFRGSAVAFLVRRILKEEGKKSNSINVILVDDEYLLEVNRKFLNHNYRTDVISFDLGDEGIIDGEIYVSVDRASVQARRYRVSCEEEVLRLIVHGILHLSGWDDSTRSQKLRMRKRENLFIRTFYKKNSRPIRRVCRG